MTHEGADVGVVSAARSGGHIAIKLAEAGEGFRFVQSMQLRERKNSARAFICASGIRDAISAYPVMKLRRLKVVICVDRVDDMLEVNAIGFAANLLNKVVDGHGVPQIDRGAHDSRVITGT